MKKHFSARAKWLIVIAVLLAMGITVFHAVSSRRPGQTVVQTILAPFRSAGSTLVRQVERYYDYVFQYESLQAENKALREQIMAMEEDVRSADSLQRENERLHQLLGLVEEHRDYYPTSAYIISWNGSNWKSAFTIDKGTSSGIEEGMVAITEYSQVVGLVTEAGPNWATVTTVLDSVLGISASVASSGYNGMLEMAEDNFTYAYESGNDLLLEFESVRDARISRADGRVLTLNLGTYTYSGGAHGYYLSRAYVFDTRSGDLITLEQLSPDLPALRTYLVQRMIEMVQTDPTLAAAIDGFVEESNRETSFGALIRDGSWYLDDRGLVVFSDLYEISSYAAGMQTFVFPYEELGGLVDLKCFPDSKNSSGSF